MSQEPTSDHRLEMKVKHCIQFFGQYRQIDNIDSCQFHVLSSAGGLGHGGENCNVFQQGLIVFPFRGMKLTAVYIVYMSILSIW